MAPCASRAVGPTQSGLPRDILASGSRAGARLYRCSSSFRWASMTAALAAMSAFMFSSKLSIGFLAFNGSR